MQQFHYWNLIILYFYLKIYQHYHDKLDFYLNCGKRTCGFNYQNILKCSLLCDEHNLMNSFQLQRFQMDYNNSFMRYLFLWMWQYVHNYFYIFVVRHALLLYFLNFTLMYHHQYLFLPFCKYLNIFLLNCKHFKKYQIIYL